ncbi:2-hydroxyacyl-CoA dehydratase subunit D [Calderihabitans maritimus]|uniref:Benzoyl-CoA reductase, gamma subunit n=1 Tax=Calderihabitans maritimus TaxID=1246530 RepID=A0A1Z5HUK8_9FIRM|nr:2-hydroxyacyl-CoA dehydratase family protein [Calderihabitans maritimus]GAW92970.1 benzoyl-CoA reductase, gamma subunit [Calderihabitans maritimus]
MIEKIRKTYDALPIKNESIKRWKDTGNKVFGYMCNHVPEEILFAAGIFPVKFLGSPVDIVEANQYHSIYMCHYGRSILELGLQGEYANLDGVVGAYSCEGGCNLIQVLMETVEFSYTEFLHFPHNAKTDLAFRFLLREFSRFKESLEEYIGSQITDDALKDAIAVYNENRKLLRRVYDLRGQEKIPLLTGVEVGEIARWVMEVPKSEANAILREVIKEAQRRVKKEFSGPRIHVTGTVLPDLELFELVEELGGMVVSDDLCTGSRYFWDQVATDLPPLEALARYKLERIPCSSMCSEFVAEDRVKHILDLVERYRVDAVIFTTHKWCDSQQMDRPFMIKELEKAGLPVLSAEIERTIGAGQLKTRLQAFFEMIGEQKNVS